MNSGIPQQNLKTSKIARCNNMSVEALSWLLAGVVVIPASVILLFVLLVDWRAIEKLPEIYGFLSLLVLMLVMITTTIIFVWGFPKITRLLFADAYQITLHEDGIVILAHKKEREFYSYEELDRISVELSETDVSLNFFKNDKQWMFTTQKHKNQTEFSRVVRWLSLNPIKEKVFAPRSLAKGEDEMN